MSKLVIQSLEQIDIGHNDSHGIAIAARTLDFFHDAQFEEAPVEDAGQTIEVSELFHALDVVRVLNRVGANISYGLERLQLALAESVDCGTVQREYAQGLAEGN